MSRAIQITLGIVSSIGGFFDMGEIVTMAVVGARFGYGHIWVVALGTVGIILYAEMSARIAVMSRRPVFDVVRERLGAKVAFVNLVASVLINIVTLVAEVAGIALAFQLLTSLSYFLWVPLALGVLFFILWKVKFERMERTVGIIGLSMVVLAVAVWRLHPDWGQILGGVINPDIPASETLAGYWYYAVAIFGAALTPYEVFFYSSSAVEERWGKKDLLTNKVTAYVGWLFGGALAASLVCLAALVFKPAGIQVENLSTVALAPAASLGSIGLALFLVGLFASTIGAALEVTLANGYALAQFFGWTWGKRLAPAKAARFHLVLMVSLVIAALVVWSSLDPVKVTELAVVLAAFAIPLTYFPVLLVANDRQYMKEFTNGRALNTVAIIYLLITAAVSFVVLPLMIWTRMGS